jgi:hypothetical protein
MKKAGYILCAVILLVIPFSSGASVQFTPAFLGAGARISLVVPQWYDLGFGLGGHADIMILPLVHLYPSIEYNHSGSSIVDDDATPSGLYHKYSYLNDFSLNGDLRFYPRVGKFFVSPFFGGGFAFVVDNQYYSYVNATDSQNRWHNSTTDTGLGIDFLCGLDFPMGNIIGNVEMKVNLTTTDETIFKITGGVTFPLSGSSAQKHHSQEE